MVLGADEPVTVADAGNRCKGSCIVAVEHATCALLCPCWLLRAARFRNLVNTAGDECRAGGHLGSQPSWWSGWPRWISARRRWWRARGCRTTPNPAGASRCAALPPRPGRCRGLADWLDGLGVTRVVMESGVHRLEAAVLPAGGAVGVLVGERPRGNARARPAADGSGRTPSGRPSSPERGMLRGQASCRRRGSGSCGTPTRYRRTLIHERTREQQRAEQAARGHPDQPVGGGQ